MNNKDPLGIPNCCFSLVNRKDKRWKEFKADRLKQGFDESELWSFSTTFCAWLLPRVEWYKDHVVPMLNEEKPEEWDKLIYALWFINVCQSDSFFRTCVNNNLSALFGLYSYLDAKECIKEHMDLIFNMGW